MFVMPFGRAVTCAMLTAAFLYTAGHLQAVEVRGQEPAVLSADRPTERGLARGEVHRYPLALGAGEYARAVVEQRGIDAVIQVIAPDGTTVLEFQDEVTPNGQELVEVVAEAAGIYVITIAPAPGIVTPGSYAIRLDTRHTATPADRTLYEGRASRMAATKRSEQDDFTGAVRLLERSVASMESVKGPEDRETADVMAQLADTYLDLRDIGRAEQNFLRAIAILEKTRGPNHPITALARARLARVYRQTDQRLNAEALIRTALDAIEKSLGTDHVFYVTALSVLQGLRDDAMDTEQGLAISRRQQAILEKLQYTDSLLYAQVLNNLGSISLSADNDAQAKEALEQSVALYSRLRGEDSSLLTNPLINLGIVFGKAEDYNPAEAAFMRALRIRQRVFGPDHPELVALLNNLANVYMSRHENARALEALLSGLRASERAYGVYHRHAVPLMANIALCYMREHDLANAVAFQRRMERVVETQLALNLAVGSERQKLLFARNITQHTDRTISLALNIAPDNPDAAALAALVILQRKGRVLDAMVDTIASVRQRVAEPADLALLDQLKSTSTQLAGVALTPTGAEEPEARHARIQTLETKKEQLESEIGSHSAEFRAQTLPVTLEAVQAALADDTALVEYAIFRPFDPASETNSGAEGPPHYAAYVIRKDRGPQGFDLGPVETIDHEIEAMRQALADPMGPNPRRPARAVDTHVMQPLRAALGDSTRVLVSADGALNLVPFDALVDEHGRFLIDRYAISYLTSGRDLLRLQVRRQNRTHGNPVIIANPLFGEPRTVPPTPIVPGGQIANVRASARTQRRSVTSGDALSAMYFAPLAGTAGEARALKALFPEAALYTGRDATKAVLQQTETPALLHIASHGFFLHQDANAATPENPLLRSGLALAGANVAQPSPDAGILTALEASSLNLWGTLLVTLSACDTGVGEVRNGEGVYGLRRAFVLAGANTLVMSLWPVSDYITRDTMIVYYKGLRAGLGRGDALRRAKLDLRKRPGRQHPFYWANFIQSGEWANLAGHR